MAWLSQSGEELSEGDRFVGVSKLANFARVFREFCLRCASEIASSVIVSREGESDWSFGGDVEEGGGSLEASKPGIILESSMLLFLELSGISMGGGVVTSLAALQSMSSCSSPLFSS